MRNAWNKIVFPRVESIAFETQEMLKEDSIGRRKTEDRRTTTLC